MEERSLYGGAISCRLPSEWKDLSDMRQVPSHQECWVDSPESNAAAATASTSNGGSSSTGCHCLWVMEILDYQASVSNEDAASYFFRDLAETNSVPTSAAHFTPSTTPTILTPQSSSSLNLPETTAAAAGTTTAATAAVLCSGTGHQLVTQNRSTDLFGNASLATPKWMQVDLCVIRLPHVQTDLLVTLSTHSSSSESSNPSQEENNNTNTTALFQEILSTIRIRDWGLFNG